MKPMPRRGDKFYVVTKTPQRNGHIHVVMYEDDAVIVYFYDTPTATNYIEYSFDELEGNWTPNYGGTWYLEG